MTSRPAVIIPALVGLLLLTAPVAPAQDVRLSDAEVRQLIERLDRSRDRFERALDSDVKRSIIRGPRVEVNVGQFLDDLKRDIKAVKDRYKANYAASQEVLKVLRSCTDIDDYVSRQPGNFKGRSEWDAMAADLRRLATAYGTTFPLPGDGTARRMTDAEVATTAAQVATNAKAFRNQAKKAMRAAKADPATIRTMERESEALERAARALQARVRGNKPATAEARQVNERAQALAAVAQPDTLGGQVTTTWRALTTNLDKLSQAFGLGASPM